MMKRGMHCLLGVMLVGLVSVGCDSSSADSKPEPAKLPPDGDLCLLVPEQEIVEMFGVRPGESEPGPGGMTGCSYNFRSENSDSLEFSIHFGKPRAERPEKIDFHGLKAQRGAEPEVTDAFSCVIDVWIRSDDESVLSVRGSDFGKNPKLCGHTRQLTERAYAALPEKQPEAAASSKSLPESSFCRTVTSDDVARVLNMKVRNPAKYIGEDSCYYTLSDSEDRKVQITAKRGTGVSDEATRIPFEGLDARLFNGGSRENCELTVRLEPDKDKSAFTTSISYWDSSQPPCDEVQKVAKLVYDELPG